MLNLIPIKKAIIPASGKGTRWAPFTKAVPKELVPIWDRPAIDYVVQEVLQIAETVVIVTTPDKLNLLEAYFIEDPRVKFCIQETANGLGGAIMAARDYVKDVDRFIVALPDVILDSTTNLYWRKPNCIMLRLTEVEQLCRYGVADVTDSEIIGCVEKPLRGAEPSHWSIVGRYTFDQKIFEALEHVALDANGEIQLTPAIDMAIRDGGDPWSWSSPSGRVFDVGTPMGAYEAWNHFSLERLVAER